MIQATRPVAYLVALDLAARNCVVLGGDAMAAQRVDGLLEAGAQVTVVAAGLQPGLRRLADRGDITWLPRGYRPGDLRGAFLSINTGEDPLIEAAVREEAATERVLLNTIDRPVACDFATPAVVRRGPLQVAVSTSGESPFVAAALRERLEQLVGPEWGALTTLVGRVRRRLRHAGVPAEEQRRTYRRLLAPAVRTMLSSNDPASTSATRAVIDAAAPDHTGTVHLVGAGPGPAGLLSLAARDLLLDADVVFHDALVSPEVLRLCGSHARLVDVGKRGGGVQTDQDEITAMLIASARAGHEVVRLKGGDPFLFGRGGEELAALRRAGIDAVVIPGISSALAAPALADIPLTMRGVSGSVAVVAGQDSNGNLPASLEQIAANIDTLVVLMPLRSLAAVTSRIAPVRGRDWPAALVAAAGSPEQRVLRGTVGDIADLALADGIGAPATLVLGDVVTSVSGPILDRPVNAEELSAH